jgi:hypothetical protein
VVDQERAEYCRNCRAVKKTEPPCAAGEWRQPELDPGNETAMELWLMVRIQWRVAGLGVVGLDYLAVQQEADRLEIDLNRCLMRKIQALERMEVQKQHAADGDHTGAGPSAAGAQGPA